MTADLYCDCHKYCWTNEIWVLFPPNTNSLISHSPPFSFLQLASLAVTFSKTQSCFVLFSLDPTAKNPSQPRKIIADRCSSIGKLCYSFWVSLKFVKFFDFALLEFCKFWFMGISNF